MTKGNRSPKASSFNKRSVKDIPTEPTRHGALKRVLIRHEEVNSDLMFLNEVYVSPGEVIQAHQHEDMEEVFYFLEGEGRMHIEEDVQPVTAGDRIIIPIQTVHFLENTGNREMRFVCFGVKARPAEA